MLISEGTYPFYGGGVSTWSHMLCQKLRGVNWFLYSINAGYEDQPLFDLTENVKEVIQLPIWAPDEPQDYKSFVGDYTRVVDRKLLTTKENVESAFVPIFRDLLKVVYDEEARGEEIDRVFYALWQYFQIYDYKETFQQECVWKLFQTEAILHNRHDGIKATLFDLTVALRWFYRFLMPFALSVKKVDLCHITSSGFPLIPALTLKYQYDVPLLMTEHGVYARERLLYINRSDYSYFIKDFLINLTETVTTLSYYKADKIASVNQFNTVWEKLYGADENKINVIYNGVDHTQFIPRDKPKDLKGVPTVVAAARIFDLKDILTMIRTCEVVKRRIPNVQFLVYGDDQAVPEYTAECKALIRELKLKNNFFLKGFHERPHELYCEGDISILTSISEGFPYTVIESMSCGVPVVATDVGGVKEAVDEMSGYVCKPRDHEAIAEKVVELLLDKELRSKMSSHARERVLEYFTLDHFVSEYQQLYASIGEEKVVRKEVLIELL